MARPPPALMRWQISSSACPARAARTSLAPSLAAASAVARPMPLDAPVITMTCWSRGLRSTAVGYLLDEFTTAAEMPPLLRERKGCKKRARRKDPKDCKDRKPPSVLVLAVLAVLAVLWVL